MVRKDGALMAAEKQEQAERETAQVGKALGSMPGSEEERRQQALDMLRKKAQAKREGKRVAVDDSVADMGHKQAAPKRARAPRTNSVVLQALEKGTKGGDKAPAKPTKPKAPRKKVVTAPPLEKDGENSGEASSQENDGAGYDPKDPNTKGYNGDRDRTKIPSEDELLAQLRHGITWLPTRFADKRVMKDLYIDQDMKDLLDHMGMESFYSMAHPTHKEVSCQFLATLEATFHTIQHEKQGWGNIKFKIDGERYLMTFAEIGEVLGLKDAKVPSLPKPKKLPKGKSIAHLTFKLLSGKNRVPSRDKNASIRHPSVRYLHRLLVHTLLPRKEIGNVNGDDLRLLHLAVQHYACPPQLPKVPSDLYNDFGMVGFFVERLMHYKRYAWINGDPQAQIGIGGLITPLLQHMGVSLSDDATGPWFMDLVYLRSAQYFTGRYNGLCVYSYLRGTKAAELCLPHFVLTTLMTPGTISFDISEEHLLKEHGPLAPIALPTTNRSSKNVSKHFEDLSSTANQHLFGPPRYHFHQCTSSLPPGPLRQAHDHISSLQRWSKAQDRTVYKLTNKCKELRKTVKRQAEASAKFMKKVADILTRGAVAGCSAEDFDLDAFLTPPPLPLYDPSAPVTRKQQFRQDRNPQILPSESGNKSPSLASTDEEDDSEVESSTSSHAP